MPALMNTREIMIVILLCTIASLMVIYRSETSIFQHQYQEQQERYTNNQHDLPPSSSYEFINPFRNHISLQSNNFGAPIPNNIEELIHNQMPPIPAAYANLADLNKDFQQQQYKQKEEPINDKTDDKLPTENLSRQEQVPFFWHIARTGGATMAQAFGECLGLTLASSASSIPSSSRSTTSFQNVFYGTTNKLNQQSLVILRHDESKYVNVNLDTDDGILRAKELQILQQKDENNEHVLVNVIISPSVYTTSKILFAPSETMTASNPVLPPKGQLFTMIRHPVEREISYFYALKSSSMDRPLQMEKEWANIASYELSDWLKSSSFLDNIMVRSLINNFDRSYIVTVQDLLVSKEVLRRKCLVGLLDEKASSWRRMRKYFGKSWDRLQHGDLHGNNDASRNECEQKLLFWGWCNRNPHRPYVNHDFGSGWTGFATNVDKVVGKKSYEQIEILNKWDMILYEYAKYLFWQQGAWLGFDIVKE